MAEAIEAVAGQAERPRAQGTPADDTVARGAFFSFAAKIAGAAFTGALTIFLARRLGASPFGVFSLGLSIIGLFSLVSDFGVAVALPRFLAESRADPRRLAELVADGLRLEVLGSSLVGGMLAALAEPLADAYHAPGLAAPLRYLALALFGQNLLFFSFGVFTGMRRQAYTLWSSFGESAAEFTVTIALVLIAGGATAAAAGRAAGYAIGAVCGIVLIVRLLGRGIVPNPLSGRGHTTRIVGYAGTLWIVDSVFTVFTQVDSLLIGALLTAGSVGFFQAPMRLITLLQYPGYAIASAVSPRLARARDTTPDVAAFHGAMRLIVVTAVAAATLTTVWATPIIDYALGRGYGPAHGVLRALGPYVALSGLGVLVSTALNYLGGARRRIPIAVATVVVNLVIDLILIPRIGVVGGAVGSDAGFGVYVLAQLRFCARMLGIPLRPYAVMVARCLLAAVPMAGVLAAVGTGALPVPVALAGGIVACAAYGVGLLAVRETTPGEVMAASDRLAGALARVARARRRG